MGISLIILIASSCHGTPADIPAALRPVRQVQVRQQIYIERQDINTKKIIEAIKGVRK